MSDNLSFYEHSKSETPLSIVSVPFELGSDVRGLSDTPRYLFESGLEKMLSTIGANVASFETIECPDGREASGRFPKHMRETAAVARAASEAVSDMRRRGEKVLALCGDHASAIGTIKGAAAAEEIGVIYLDAHPDILTHENTISGNTHAMVSSAALGMGHESLACAGGIVRPEHFLYIGMKDFDEPEIRALRSSGTRFITMLDIALHGLSEAVAAIDELRRKVGSVWISMDMDSVDKMYAPGVAMPCEGGFTRREISALARYIGKTCVVAGMDVVEMLPGNDVEGKTAGLAVELIALFLGAEYTWYRGYMRPYEAMRGQAQGAKPSRRTSRAALPRTSASRRS
ncbi:MAG TPA: arginase family protein [Candidatus Paceibacterota bacterium]|jgi:arginase|nr:arginase family protein [Candidatus Paceibacterota bacterium]